MRTPAAAVTSVLFSPTTPAEPQNLFVPNLFLIAEIVKLCDHCAVVTAFNLVFVNHFAIAQQRASHGLWVDQFHEVSHCHTCGFH